MKPEQFYDNLREQDRSHVKTVVEDLKKSGFDVYVTGSSLEREDYNDVDLVVVPQQQISYADDRNTLDRVIEQYGGKERSLKVTDFFQKKAPHVNIEEVIDELSKLFINPVTRDSIEYAGSKVEARYILPVPSPFEEVIPSLQGDVGISHFDSLSDSGDLPFPMRSHVDELRIQREKEKTTLDICLSYEPFGIAPTIRHIQL